MGRRPVVSPLLRANLRQPSRRKERVMKREVNVRRTIISSLVISLVILGYGVSSASAQVLYGSVVGTVTDQVGAVVPGATIKVTNTATGLTRQVTADVAGSYSITNLLEGDYELTVSASGFKRSEERRVGKECRSRW